MALARQVLRIEEALRPVRPESPSSKHSKELAAELRRKIKGEVRFDEGSRALYATDLSIYRQVPIGVVIPRDNEDVIETIALCRQYSAPVLGRGCGTSLAGQTCNVAVILDFSKYMNRILELNPNEKYAWVQPGVICDQLRNAAEQYHLTFAPDPATHRYCTLGGMIGNNSCGVHSVMGGKTVDNLHELEIVTYDGLHMRVGATGEAQLEQIIREGGRRGEIYSMLKSLRDRYGEEVRQRYPKIPRRVSGYNLDELLPENGFHVGRALVGSESTCVMVLRAKVRLVNSPPGRALVVIGYPNWWLAGDHVPAILATKPIGLEGFHAHLLENMQSKGQALAGRKYLPEGETWLLVEYGGKDVDEAADRATAAMDRLKGAVESPDHMRVLKEASEQQAVWHFRESGVGASRVPGQEDSWPSWEDTAVAPDKLGAYLREFSKLIEKHHYVFTMYGHFGDGCIHTRFNFDLKTTAGVKNFRSFMEEGADLVVRFGGSISGEHGDGQARGELLPKMYGPELIQAFREFKSIWDPQWRMNPGKLIDPYRLDENLRAGPDYHPKPVFTHFQFPDDHGSMAQATERCFGVGLCRSLNANTMCPSFRATREEQHTTRGRAHMLFEMLRGEAIHKGWRDEHVKESLDLCLSCKGCKGDCPVHVDIATYKAEFLAHYYHWRLRPRSAYAFGLVNVWAKLAALAPGFVNLLASTPGLREFAKFATDMPQQRHIPRFAPETFRSWFHKRAQNAKHARGPEVMLFTDTFTNHFHPEIGRAAVEVLETAGFSVAIPGQSLCCGRPLYDYGMLSRAKTYLRRTLKALEPQIRAGTPIVVLEPSCASVFRDELHGMLPNDEDGKRFRNQVFLLSEFLEQRAPDFRPQLQGKAVLHGHCHHKSILKMHDEIATLQKLGLDCEVLDSGCCGMAGSFGFEKEKYGVSLACGEHVLLPAVRNAEPSTIIVADGFSCREQIAQTTDRQGLHLAQVLQMALHRAESGVNGGMPERPIIRQREEEERRSMVRAGATFAGIAGSVALGTYLLSRSRRR